MSKVAIQGAATGTGVFTLASPATNTDRTLVLPDEAGTVLTRAAGSPDNSVVVNASGNVGIGTSPANKLHVAGNVTLANYANIGATGNDAGISLTGGSATNNGGQINLRGGSFSGNTSGIEFIQGGTERMRINSAGSVGIGTSSMTRFFNLYDTTTNAQTAYFKSTQASGGAGFVAYNNNGEASVFQHNGSTNTSYGGANSVNIGSLTNNPVVFIANNTERARITSAGDFLVGKTSNTFGNAGATIQSDGAVLLTKTISDSGGAVLYLNRLNVNGAALIFYKESSEVGTITVTASATAYNTSSDYRLKNTIAPMTGALAKVQALKPVTYKWNADGSDGQGFIAHELAEVVPDCVSGTKDAVETYTDEDGNEQTRPKYQGIDTSFLVATLTAAIQELKAINDAQAQTIESLTARVSALEAS